MNNLHRSLKIFDLLYNTLHDKDSIDSELVYALIFLKNFHVITGCEKNIIYMLSKESADRGSINVFHDHFKECRKLASKKTISMLEKYIFDSDTESSEKCIVSEIFRLVEYAD